MNVLLDSQAIFWKLTGDSKLSRTAADLFADSAVECFVSPVSHWEMALKISIGKYQITDDFESLWRDALARFRVLTIEPRRTARLIDLPFHHKDPFDRMLIAQSLADQIPLVSSDRKFDAYGVRRLW